MCLILAAYDYHPDYSLIVAANRDEYYFRPSAKACFWEDNPGIMAGRDLEKLGTWLGITIRGRFAALTNYRDPASAMENARSRGLLVKEYLVSDASPPGYIEEINKVRGEYNGFNLLLTDMESMWYYSGRTGGAESLGPGIYGLSNHLLDTPWPKVARSKEALRSIIQNPGEDLAGRLFDLLSDRRRADDPELPRTGVSLEWERLLSPVFIQSEVYGTRASTVLLIGRDRQVRFYERSFGPGGRLAGDDVSYQFDLKK